MGKKKKKRVYRKFNDSLKRQNNPIFDLLEGFREGAQQLQQFYNGYHHKSHEFCDFILRVIPIMTAMMVFKEEDEVYGIGRGYLRDSICFSSMISKVEWVKFLRFLDEENLSGEKKIVEEIRKSGVVFSTEDEVAIVDECFRKIEKELGLLIKTNHEKHKS